MQDGRAREGSERKEQQADNNKKRTAREGQQADDNKKIRGTEPANQDSEGQQADDSKKGTMARRGRQGDGKRI